MLRQTVDNRTPLLLFPSFFPRTLFSVTSENIGVAMQIVQVLSSPASFCFLSQEPLQVTGRWEEFGQKEMMTFRIEHKS
jgi:hypothetical protein